MRTVVAGLHPIIIARTENVTPASNMRVQPVCLRSWNLHFTLARILAASVQTTVQDDDDFQLFGISCGSNVNRLQAWTDQAFLVSSRNNYGEFGWRHFQMLTAYRPFSKLMTPCGSHPFKLFSAWPRSVAATHNGRMLIVLLPPNGRSAILIRSCSVPTQPCPGRFSRVEGAKS